MYGIEMYDIGKRKEPGKCTNCFYNDNGYCRLRYFPILNPEIGCDRYSNGYRHNPT